MQPNIKNDLLYLLRMIEAIEKIKIYSADFDDPLTFFDANEQKDFNACLTLLTHIGEQVTRISVSLKESYPLIEWQKIKDYRNKITHDYTNVDRFITFEVIKNHLPALQTDIQNIIQEQVKQEIFSLEEFILAKTSPYFKHINFDNFDLH